MNRVTALVFSAVLLTFVGCATPVTREQITSADYGKFPSTYKESIQGYMSNVLIDPESGRYRFFEKPVKGYAYINGTLSPPEFGYLVFAGINAKNRYGGYTGEKAHIFFFRDDKFYDITSGTKWERVE